MQLPTVLVGICGSIPLRILDNVPVRNCCAQRNGVINDEAEIRCSRFTSSICQNMNLTHHVDVRLRIGGEGAGNGLTFAVRDHTLECSTATILIINVEAGIASTQRTGQLDGDCVSFSHALPTRIEREVHNEVVPDKVRTGRVRPIDHRNCLHDVYFCCLRRR